MKFKRIPKKDYDIIKLIIARMKAINAIYKNKKSIDELGITMDLVAVHQNDVILDFNKLLEFHDFSFIYDITGIGKHIDRATGKLTKGFIPRCAIKIIDT